MHVSTNACIRLRGVTHMRALLRVRVTKFLTYLSLHMSLNLTVLANLLTAFDIAAIGQENGPVANFFKVSE